MVLKNCVATWQAYNTWGGYDLYNGPTGSYGDRSLAVSLDRPYDQEGAYLFMVYERKLINLAERLGLPLAYLTSMDIASDAHALDGASALISPGHDEYWSPPERANVTAARTPGSTWRSSAPTRCSGGPGSSRPRSARTGWSICYKTSYMQDPMYGKDNALVTNDWREPPDPDPESSVIGTLYESYPAVADYVVATPDAWMFAGTGARKGTSFAALVGIEYDRVNPGYPVQRPIQVLSHSPLTCNGVNSYADSAYYTHSSGAGVFNAGTMRWVESFGPPLYSWGITAACGRFTRQVTANVLRAFADGPAAAKYPAHDNLDAMNEWPGDPIAAGPQSLAADYALSPRMLGCIPPPPGGASECGNKVAARTPGQVGGAGRSGRRRRTGRCRFRDRTRADDSDAARPDHGTAAGRGGQPRRAAVRDDRGSPGDRVARPSRPAGLVRPAVRYLAAVRLAHVQDLV